MISGPGRAEADNGGTLILLKLLQTFYPVVVILLVHLDLVIVAAGGHDVVVRMPHDLELIIRM